jgi:hypothetical protein
MLLGGVLAAMGQTGVNVFGQPLNISGLPGRIGQRLASWAPMKSLTDDEYEKLLQERLLRLDVEISLLDDQIADLKVASKQQAVAVSNTQKPST